jgi:hypothetical protein
MMGQSNRDILRLEARARQKVDPIVKSENIETSVREMRARLIALGEDAVLSVQKALREKPDARLAFEILKSIGVIPDRHDANGALVQQPPTESDEEADVDKMLIRLHKSAAAGAAIYRRRCPEMDAALEEVGGRLNYETGKYECVPEKS